jgi:chromatin segregation and condensation protein Rec8/ScpA/Scc1 (kleisin family)
MSFQLDHNDVFSAAIPDGEYEVVIKRVGENVTQNGAEYAEFDLIIRNDVEQPNKNNHIFHKAWKTKATGEYNSKSFNIIGKAAKLQNGKVYSSLEDLFRDFENRAVRVRVKNETSQHNGTTYENLNVKNWVETKIDGPIRHVYKEQAAQNAANQAFSAPYESEFQISDDDLPF